jgi:methionine synthase II (cobalamin-independent)
MSGSLTIFSQNCVSGSSAVGPVSLKNLEYAQLWRTAQKRTDRPMKFGGISAQEVEALIVNEFYKDRRELVMDLSSTFNEEYHELADAGCKIIQIEEPAKPKPPDADYRGSRTDAFVRLEVAAICPRARSLQCCTETRTLRRSRPPFMWRLASNKGV